MLNSILPGTDILRIHQAAIVESSDDAILGMSAEGVILSWNLGAERLLGYTAAEIVGGNIRCLIPAPWTDEELTVLERTLRGDRVDIHEALRQTKDGKVIEVSLTVSPIKAPDGSIVGVSHVARLVGDRTRLEWSFQEKQSAVSDLAASEIRYRRLFEAARDGILLLDAESGKIVDVNPFLEELLGMSRKEFLGKPLWELGPLKDVIANLDAFQELKKKGYIRYEHLPLETAQGKEVHVEFVSNVYVASGERVIQCNIRDITNRFRTEEALTKAQELLRHSQKMEAFGQLAAGVAHDFNNLLTVINGYSELLAGRLGSDSPLQSDVAEIAKAGQRAALLTRQLLAFSRRQVLEPRVLDLNHVVTDMDRMLKRVIGEDITVVKILGAEPWAVKIDPGQLEQVILNLAVNARDAMPKGGKLTIETANVILDGESGSEHTPPRSGPHVLLTVKDTGCGMSEEVRTRLFEPFFTTKGPGQGTGLGLPTVLGIVQQSGGSIQVESAPGKGATFKIYLPRVDEPTDRSIAAKSGVRVPRGSETILVAEDEAIVRKLTCRILETQGYKVLEAASGPEAIKLSNRHAGSIDLLLTDMVMPGMSGLELYSELSGLRPTMKTLFVSGYANDSLSRHGGLKPGMSFLQKPYSTGDLTARVRGIIDAK